MIRLSQGENFTLEYDNVGHEKTPVLVIDDFVAQSDWLIAQACTTKFERQSQLYPGIRAPAPIEYRHYLQQTLSPILAQVFNLPNASFITDRPQYSLVTQAANQLSIYQRIPHVDSLDANSFAVLHYLFRQPLGGTGFYRHKKTGFERLNALNNELYFQSLEKEDGSNNIPRRADGYINGDTALFQRIGSVEGIFNRLVVYPCNLLHSGNIEKEFQPDNNPKTGRLTIKVIKKDIQFNFNSPRLITYQTGTRRKHWHKNCVAIGLSAGFIEPLESTGIHLFQAAIIKLLQNFPVADIHSTERDEFNLSMQNEMNQIRDFIVLHYCTTKRTDSPFWQHCQNMEIPESLKHKIEMFRHSGRIGKQANELFDERSWVQVMLGMGIEPMHYHPVVDRLTQADLQDFVESVKHQVKQIVARWPSHQQFIQAYCPAK